MANFEPQSFATLFRTFRLKSGISTLTELADKLAEQEGIVYENSLYTKWQQGKRIPHDRKTILKLIHFFHTHNAITTIDEANQLLTSTGLSPLTTDEMGDIDLAHYEMSKLIKRSNPIVTLHAITVGVVKSRFVHCLSALYMFVVAWFVFMKLNGIGDIVNLSIWTLTYGILAFSSVAYSTLRKPNSHHSEASRYFAYGLMGQGIGLVIWVAYNLTGTEVPYPSLADLGYASLIPCYILASLYFIGSPKADDALQFLRRKDVLLFTIPIGILLGGYMYYAAFAGQSVLIRQITSILNILYPLGEMAPVMIVLYGYIKQKLTMQTSEKMIILFLIAALIFQFVTDYTFVIRSQLGLYGNGDIVDPMYATAYFMMSIALVIMHEAQQRGLLQESNTSQNLSPNIPSQPYHSQLHTTVL